MRDNSPLLGFEFEEWGAISDRSTTAREGVGNVQVLPDIPPLACADPTIRALFADNTLAVRDATVIDADLNAAALPRTQRFILTICLACQLRCAWMEL